MKSTFSSIALTPRAVMKYALLSVVVVFAFIGARDSVYFHWAINKSMEPSVAQAAPLLSGPEDVREQIQSWLKSGDPATRCAFLSTCADLLVDNSETGALLYTDDSHPLESSLIASILILAQSRLDKRSLYSNNPSLMVIDGTTFMDLYAQDWRSMDIYQQASLIVAEMPTSSSADIRRILEWGPLDGAPAEVMRDSYVRLLITRPMETAHALISVAPQLKENILTFLGPPPEFSREEVTLLTATADSLQGDPTTSWLAERIRSIILTPDSKDRN